MSEDTILKPERLGVIEMDGQVSSARYSPCGNFLLGPGFDGLVHRWKMVGDEVPAAEFAAVTGHNGWVTAIGFTKSKQVISADSWGLLRCWAYEEEVPKTVWRIEEAHDGWIRDLAVSPDGQWVATCGRDGAVRIRSTKDGAERHQWKDHEEDVYAVAFHPSGKWLVSGDLKGRVLKWDLASGKQVQAFEAENLYLYHRIQDVGGVRRLAFDQEGKTLAVAGGIPEGGGFVKGKALVKLFDFEAGKLKEDLALDSSNKDVFVHDMFFHAKGYFMAVTSGQPGNGRLLCHRPGEEKPFLTYADKLMNCHSISLHPAGQTVAVVATSKGSNGNGRKLVEGKYLGNKSPIHLLRIVG